MKNSFGIIGGGSWATALAKILTDKKLSINWWLRTPGTLQYFLRRGHNPHYLTTTRFDLSLLALSNDLKKTVSDSEVLVIATPSAYAADVLSVLDKNDLRGKKIVSAIKGLLPDHNLLLNEFLATTFDFPVEDYFAILGPCHAEEVAAERLSYLTISGVDEAMAGQIASGFSGEFINTIVNHDIMGVQYAAVMKNIYALGAGIAHGLDYGDNFLSVYIANVADEMAGFLRKYGAQDIVVGEHLSPGIAGRRKTPNYAASVYLGDLLVTCYSLHSRNRSFGNMIGKGYSVKAAQLEMNMVAEGINASRSIHLTNKNIDASIPIADTIYEIIWEKLDPATGFKKIEEVLV